MILDEFKSYKCEIEGNKENSIDQYIIVIKNSIVNILVNILLSSPSSIHWGYACDRIFDKGSSTSTNAAMLFIFS